MGGDGSGYGFYVTNSSFSVRDCRFDSQYQALSNNGSGSASLNGITAFKSCIQPVYISTSTVSLAPFGYSADGRTLTFKNCTDCVTMNGSKFLVNKDINVVTSGCTKEIVVSDTSTDTFANLMANKTISNDGTGASVIYMDPSLYETVQPPEKICSYSTALPTASATYRGQVRTVEGASGTADQTYVCIKDANDTYAWINIDNLNISLDSSPNKDKTGNGTITTETVDTNSVGVASALVLASDGHYDEVDASASSTMPCSALALETGTGSKTILHQGFIRNDAWSWTVGGVIYVSETTGTLTQTAPTTSSAVVQVVGIAKTADIIYFNPSYNMVVVS